MGEQGQKLRLGALVALVVGSMIGGGIFSLPQNMAARAQAGAVLIGWGITAVGMLALAFVFQTLANRKPELDSGVYAYIRIDPTVQVRLAVSQGLEYESQGQHAHGGDRPANQYRAHAGAGGHVLRQGKYTATDHRADDQRN